MPVYSKGTGACYCGKIAQGADKRKQWSRERRRHSKVDKKAHRRRKGHGKRTGQSPRRVELVELIADILPINTHQSIHPPAGNSGVRRSIFTFFLLIFSEPNQRALWSLKPFLRTQSELCAKPDLAAGMRRGNSRSIPGK